MLCAWLLFLVLAFVASLVIAAMFLANASGPDDFISGVTLASLFSLLFRTLFAPFITAVTVLLYFDLRIRKEGFDLALMAQQVAHTPPA